ncbi:MAG: pantoate--beta-alanine ligase [Pseudomonadota bacterium]
MLIIKDKIELSNVISQFKQQSQSINFVPTMGNLHQGHIELVNKANSLTGKTIVSIFVNPMQFNNPDDLLRYPRTLDADIQKLIDARADLLFVPDVASIYPAATTAASRTRVVVPALGDILEGESRPGHFDGVSTVVTKLFNLVQADQAIFGEKDFQQLAIIRKMVLDLDMPVQIHSHPIIRESDGLAMSSRNSRLNKQQRETAPALYQALQKLQAELQQGNKNYSQLQQEISERLDSTGFITDYLMVADATTLLPADNKTKNIVLLAAVILGEIRLIDNIHLN